MILYYSVPKINMWQLYIDIQCNECGKVSAYSNNGINCIMCNYHSDEDDDEMNKMSKLFSLIRSLKLSLGDLHNRQLIDVLNYNTTYFFTIRRMINTDMDDRPLTKEHMKLLSDNSKDIIVELQAVKLEIS